jgi:photosystem II stability/assembly factor-like uncharacterized protein
MFFIIPVVHITIAQPWMAKVKPDSSRNFYVIKKAFDNYWAGKKPVIEKNEKEESETPEDGSYLQFERWANFIEPRVFPSGNLFDPTILQKEFEKNKSLTSLRTSRANTSDWSFIGPAVVPGSGGDAGRVNCITISPTDTNTIFVGAASGGLWVTHNGGTTWSTTTDLLPAICIADIAINPNNSDTMYVATGDGYGYNVPEGNIEVFWGGTYSAGVMKSTDGGNTWNTTGLGYPDDSLDIIQRLIISPNDPNILIAATTNGIYRTTNAGTTWLKVFSGHVFDLAFNTANADTVYATDTTDIYKSTNSGATWSALTNGLFPTSDRITISTTLANSKIIYVMNVIGDFDATGNLYESNDGGKTFNSQTFPSGASFYGYYDDVMSVSPTDANTLYCGGEYLVKSIDGGATWVAADNSNYPSTNYVHVDNHAVAFYPNSNEKVLCGNDGGIFKTTTGANSWTDLSNGLAIKQYYRMASSASNANFILAGAQDNGTDLYNGSTWNQVYGDDGMQPLVDYTNDMIEYASIEYGELFKSIDGGNAFNDITPPNAGLDNWTTPYVLNPTHHNTIIAGYNDVFRSYDGGNTWNTISSIHMVGDIINSLVIAPSDTNYIYAASYGNIISTIDNGNTWTDITGSLPISQSAISGITVSSYDPKKIWVTFSDYQDTLKVFASKDGGNTWTNYSGTLPNIPVDCITYQPNSKDVLYIGTDFGVFLRDSTMSDWTSYNTGLPNVIVNQLEIVPSDSQLRAATYGRGMWETGLYNWVSGTATINTEDNINIFPNPSNGLYTVAINSKQQDNLSLTVFNLVGEKVLTTEKEVQTGNNQFEIDLSNQAKGLYFIRINSGSQSAVKKITLVD